MRADPVGRARRASLLLALACALGPAPARGDDAPAARADGPPPGRSGFTLGARLGLATPVGKTNDTATTAMESRVPLAATTQIDVGYRFSTGLAVEGYFHLGLGLPDCPSNVTCSAALLRLGLQVEQRFRDDRTVMPWVGGGFGVESFSFTSKAGGFEVTTVTEGPEVFLQGGVDFRLGRRMSIGPYAMAVAAQYNHIEVDATGLPSSSQSIPSEHRTWHAWYHAGARFCVTF